MNINKEIEKKLGDRGDYGKKKSISKVNWEKTVPAKTTETSKEKTIHQKI